MSLIEEPLGKFNNSTLTSNKWDRDSQKMKDNREWLVNQACHRIISMCNKNLTNINDENLPEEFVFEWYNVKSDLMKSCGVLVNGKYVKNTTPMEYSFDTIFNGGFGSSSGEIDRSRLKKAGVVNPFVLDVKRSIADKCIKVWDITDKNISNKNVWRITIFVQEIRKVKEHIDITL